MTDTDLLAIEVVYALPHIQRRVRLMLPAGTSARQAAVESGINQEFPELDLNCCPIGVFGKQVADEFRLGSGDRVEIYRPLLNDPLELRRARAAGMR